MTDNLNHESRELVSALVDGELRDTEFARAMAHLDHSSEARQDWHAYHVVGQVMRTGHAEVSRHDAEFVQRLRARLQHETASPDLQPAPDAARRLVKASRPGANDRHWRLVAGLASVAMVAVLLWQGFQGPSPVAPLLALSVEADKPPAAASAMIRDPQLDALLAAHRQFGGTSALQAPTGFLRNATFEAGAH